MTDWDKIIQGTEDRAYIKYEKQQRDNLIKSSIGALIGIIVLIVIFRSN